MRNERIRRVLPILAMLTHYVVFYINSAMFVLRQEPRESLIAPGLAHMGGLVVCALAYPFLQRRTAAMAAILVFLVVSRLPGYEAWLDNQPVRLLMTCAYGLSIPLAYSAFFRDNHVVRRGLAYGSCIGAGIFATVMPLVSMTPPESDAAWNDYLKLLFSIHSAGIVALAIVLFALLWLRRPPLTESRPEPAATPEMLKTRRRTLATFLSTVIVFFLLNGFPNVKILPVLGHEFTAESSWSLILSAIACPLVGHVLDRRPARAFPVITRLCAFTLVLAPSLAILTHQPAIYGAVHWLTTLAQILFSMAMTVAAASLAGNGARRCLILCSVYLAHCASLPGIWLFRKSAGYSEGILVLLGTFTAVVLYELIGRVRIDPTQTGLRVLPQNAVAGNVYAEAGGRLVLGIGDKNGDAAPADESSGYAATSASEQDREKDRNDRNAAIFRARGLTPRECEVALLLLRGYSTRAIAEQLGVSEHTAISHIRNMLAKFGVSTRKAFLASMVDL